MTTPGFDTEFLNTLGKLISQLECFHLEGATPMEFNPVDLFDAGSEQTFFCIQGLADFWRHQGGADFGTHMSDLVMSAHNQSRADLTMILLGTPEKLACYLSLGDEETTRTLLEGIFPGILLHPVTATELTRRLPAHFLAKGVLTGIPSAKAFTPGQGGRDEHQDRGRQPASNSSGQQEQSQLERVIRGMYGATWAYAVQAHPRPRHKVVGERMKTIDLLTQISGRLRLQWQATKQDNKQLTLVESGGQTQTYSSDVTNYRAQYLIRLLERELERFDQAAAVGQWTVRSYFGANSVEYAQRLASLLLGTLAGPNSRPQPFRSSLCQPTGQPLEAFQTFLTSSEVALLTQLPREEFAGYAIHDYVRFDIDFCSPETEARTLPLGYIQQHGRDTRNTFDISLDALAKHAVVIGVTGSGKTTTVMGLLNRVVTAGRAFLVIEPAKTEYRSLYKALLPATRLRVYTLGNEMVAPFRLNPFEFETNGEPGNASLLTHIDFLKAVFNAAFVLYSPMPHVLEDALHEVYEDKGWDLASGLNRRLQDWSERHNYPIFPTLTDLYYKIDAVTERLGYDREVESNVKAGLKSRIGSLRIGSKGLMLDTPHGVPLQELLSIPTVLEMESIGSDDEKTFLMGLFLARLYEYRRLQAASGIQTQGLQHLMVFEEAHRLLQNTMTQVDTESSNMRAQAIEVFTNMLSEMRAYGQGVLVAEQIPSKLAPDVLKNTNLKVVHRLTALDDRQSIGQTMNLNEEQQTHLGTLIPGMAAVYAEGADHAYLVRLANYKRNVAPLTDGELKEIGRAYASVKPFLAIPDIDRYGCITPAGELDLASYQAASRLLAVEKIRKLCAHLLLSLSANPAAVLDMLYLFSEYIEAEMPHLSQQQQEALVRMVIIRGSAEALHERGGFFGWSYAEVEALRVSLTSGLLGFVRANQLRSAAAAATPQPEASASDILGEAEQASEDLERFIVGYTTLLERRQGPFYGCIFCPARCLYRAEVSALLAPGDQKWIDRELITEPYATDEERYGAVKKAATYIAHKWLRKPLSTELDPQVSVISYCATLHTMSWSGLDEYEQVVLSQGLKDCLLDFEA